MENPAVLMMRFSKDEAVTKITKHQIKDGRTVEVMNARKPVAGPRSPRRRDVDFSTSWSVAANSVSIAGWVSFVARFGCPREPMIFLQAEGGHEKRKINGSLWDVLSRLLKCRPPVTHVDAHKAFDTGHLRRDTKRQARSSIRDAHNHNNRSYILS